MPTAALERTDPVSLAFAALADPTRRDMLTRLSAGDATLSQLAEPYAMSLQAVSKHLAVLERAGLVTRGRDAQRRPVRSEPEALAPVTDWLEHYRRTSEERFQRLDALLSALPSADSPSTDSPVPPPIDEDRS